MWPWGHLAVGYLLYSTYARYRHHEPPAGAAVVWVAIGTQFPDLVDKPVAYWTPLLPGGRSLAHSLIVAVPLIAVALVLGRRWGHTRSAAAFAIGYVSHSLMDGFGAFVTADAGELTFLVWPLLPLPEYEARDFSHHALRLVETLEGSNSAWLLAPWSDFFVAQLWLVVGAFGLWLLHGAPPFATLRGWWVRVRGPSRRDSA